MKNFFAKPMVHYTLVLTIVAIVCGLMIGGMNALTAPIIRENNLKARVAAYENVLPAIDSFEDVDLVDLDPSSVQSKVIAKNATNQVIGYIYEVYGTNKYGYMRIVVSVDQEGMILGAQFTEINQTYQVEGTRSNLQAYVGVNVSDLVPKGDIVTGATGSLNTLKSLLSDIALAHANTVVAPDDPLIELFGEGYKMEDDPGFPQTDNVRFSKIVRNAQNEIIAGYYHLRGTSEYNPGSVGTINLYIIVDTDGEIIYVNLPRDEYGHSLGAYYPMVNSYVKSLVGDSIHDYSGDISTGDSHSNSRTLINSLLDILGGMLS